MRIELRPNKLYAPVWWNLVFFFVKPKYYFDTKNKVLLVVKQAFGQMVMRRLACETIEVEVHKVMPEMVVDPTFGCNCDNCKAARELRPQA